MNDPNLFYRSTYDYLPAYLLWHLQVWVSMTMRGLVYTWVLARGTQTAEHPGQGLIHSFKTKNNPHLFTL